MKRFVLSLALAAVLLVGAGLMTDAGVVSAHSDSNPNFQGDHADDPHPSPVGQNAFDPDFPGKFLGFGKGNAVAGITHNPNCPLHHH